MLWRSGNSPLASVWSSAETTNDTYGFIYLLEGAVAPAIPYFERSLDFRRQAGAVDQSLFAASTLASALVNLGRLEEAGPPLRYATMVAETLDSPTGKARTAV